MSSHLVEGRRLPDQIADHPALELCNTIAGWGTPTPKEYLVDPRALALWAREAGLLPTASRATDAAALAAVVALRGALYRVVTERDAAALAEVRHCVAAAQARAGYRFSEDGRVRLDVGAGPLAAVDAATLAAADLLEGPGPAAVGRCPGVGCGWLFLDPTGRRRWCDMAVCGNRAKARRYAARRSAERHRTSRRTSR